jgi:hypothetical protein
MYESQPLTRLGHWGLGTGVVQHDVALFGLAKAAEWLDHHYADRSPPRQVYILTANSSALLAITKITSLDNQQFVLRFHRALMGFCSRHKDIDITMAWSPVHRERVQDATARFKGWQCANPTGIP